MQDWVRSTIAGFGELSRSQHVEAAGHWLRARDLAEGSPPSDAIHAASQTNAGVALVMLHRLAEADAVLSEAEQTWKDALAAVATLDVPVGGTSSSFHFRLASQSLESLETFAEARRRRYAEMCETSLAIARFNRLFANPEHLADSDVEQRSMSLKGVLTETFGPRAPDVRLLAGGGALLRSPAGEELYAEKVREFERRRLTLSGALSDGCLRLETAAALTALIDPRSARAWAEPQLHNDQGHARPGPH